MTSMQIGSRQVAATSNADSSLTMVLVAVANVIRMRPGIAPCVIKPTATYAGATARFHSPAASADVSGRPSNTRMDHAH